MSAALATGNTGAAGLANVSTGNALELRGVTRMFGALAQSRT